MSHNLADEIVRKKSVHIDIPKSTHTGLRIALLKNGDLSIQSVFAEVAERIVLGDPGMIELLKELQIKKRDKTIKSLSNTDSDSVFEILERESPFSKS
jgi:hypothetical protein|tara:strand:+ start:2044 stop:2337 length:294 start_codon:yes stop_codon:yes gene_type:complete